jgi:hypothetical protein
MVEGESPRLSLRALLTLVASCGGSTISAFHPEGGPVPTTEAGALPGCITAVHADQCCSHPVAVTLQAAQADPCLARYADPFAPDVLSRCPTASSCLSLDCTFFAPPSRISGPDPHSAGTCAFLDECEGPQDCVVANDFSDCCSCPAVFPKALGPTRSCVTTVAPDSGTACVDCSAARCGPCTATVASATCGLEAGGVRVCLAAP